MKPASARESPSCGSLYGSSIRVSSLLARLRYTKCTSLLSVEAVARQAVLKTGDTLHTYKAGQLHELPVQPGEAG